MGDVFIRKARQRRDFKFVYKRKIFLHSHSWPSPDPAFNRLVYLQVRERGLGAGGGREVLDEQDKRILITLHAFWSHHISSTRTFCTPSTRHMTWVVTFTKEHHSITCVCTTREHDTAYV